MSLFVLTNLFIMKKVLLLTDKPFPQVAIDGIQKVITDAGYELKLCEKYGTDMDRVKRVAADVNALITIMLLLIFSVLTLSTLHNLRRMKAEGRV